MTFTRRGGWWVVLQVALFATHGVVLVNGGGDAPDVLLWAGACITVGGVGVVLWSTLSLGRNLSPFPEPREASSVVTSGPFRGVRHPIYSGLVMVGIGTAMADGNWAAGLTASSLAALFVLKAKNEERRLMGALPGYTEYTGLVRWRMIPGVY